MDNWCEHIKKNEIAGCFTCSIFPVDNHFKFCPICGTARPKEEEVKLEDVVNTCCGAWKKFDEDGPFDKFISDGIRAWMRRKIQEIKPPFRLDSGGTFLVYSQSEIMKALGI